MKSTAILIALGALIIPEFDFYLRHMKNASGLMPVPCLDHPDTNASQFRIVWPNSSLVVDAKFKGNSPSFCLCPDFPAISLNANEASNAWIQVIESDSAEEKLQWFVDTSSNSPLYSDTAHFSDTPHWGGIGLYFRFFTYFRARAYPTVVEQNGVFEIYPPVEWGFSAKPFRRHLQAEFPRLIQDNDIIFKDIDKLKQAYPQFEFRRR